MEAITRCPKAKFTDDNDTFITAMWLMFCRAPQKTEPDVDGKFDLSEIGSVPEKSWTRLTPYSLAARSK